MHGLQVRLSRFERMLSAQTVSLEKQLWENDMTDDAQALVGAFAEVGSALPCVPARGKACTCHALEEIFRTTKAKDTLTVFTSL